MSAGEDIPFREQYAAVVAEVARRAETTEHAVRIAYATLSCILAGEPAEAEDNIRMAGEEGAGLREGVYRAMDIIREITLGEIHLRDSGLN